MAAGVCWEHVFNVLLVVLNAIERGYQWIQKMSKMYQFHSALKSPALTLIQERSVCRETNNAEVSMPFTNHHLNLGLALATNRWPASIGA
jgi:hypothetical protein